MEICLIVLFLSDISSRRNTENRVSSWCAKGSELAMLISHPNSSPSF
uniref:Uncharacterized protein n=1 Tax=Daphnia magna TaxID=35525 RepID=A0A0P6BPV5_9CRUS